MHRSLSAPRAFRVGNAACAAVLALLLWPPGQASAQEEGQGEIIVSRDVPTRYAHLPGSGEALTVKTAPFVDVWNSIGSPAKIITDAEAATITSDAGRVSIPLAALNAGDLAKTGLENQGLGLAQTGGGGGGGTVNSVIETSMSSLQGGLSQLQSALSQSK